MSAFSAIKAVVDALPVNNKIVTSSVGASLLNLVFIGVGAAGVAFPAWLVPMIPYICVVGGAAIGQFTPSSVQDHARELINDISKLRSLVPELEASYDFKKNAGSSTGKK